MTSAFGESFMPPYVRVLERSGTGEVIDAIGVGKG
jgi:hypothetical protein